MSRTDAPGSTSTGSTSIRSTSTDDIHAGTQAEDDLVRIPAGARGLALAVAGVVLAGELSLGSAISSSDWVSSHEQYGRNR